MFRLYFASELANNQIVRFIYQGRELQDRETIRTCNIRDQTIIHCQISTRRHESLHARTDGLSSTTHMNSNTFDPSTLLDASPVNISSQFVVLLSIGLGFIWYLRIKYRQLFSPISTIILILMTIIFLIFTCGSLVSRRRSLSATIAITPIQHMHLD
jgi:transmembrane and ubiquitin-like domain-containing protein